MGGSVATQMAIAEADAKDPEIASLVLYAPLLMADSPKFLRDFMLNAPVGPLLDLILPLITPYDGLWKAVGFLMTFDWKYTKQMPAGVYRDALQVKHMGRGAAYMTAVASKPDINELGKITVPIELIFGGRDLFVMPNVAFKMWKKMPRQADKHVFLDGAHCFLQNQADRTWKTTKKFLQKTGQI